MAQATLRRALRGCLTITTARIKGVVEASAGIRIVPRNGRRRSTFALRSLQSQIPVALSRVAMTIFTTVHAAEFRSDAEEIPLIGDLGEEDDDSRIW